jgi:hypothetical protein
MERVGRWALIIGWKIFRTGEFCEDLRGLGFAEFLLGRNKIVPQAGKVVIKNVRKMNYRDERRRKKSVSKSN